MSDTPNPANDPSTQPVLDYARPEKGKGLAVASVVCGVLPAVFTGGWLFIGERSTNILVALCASSSVLAIMLGAFANHQADILGIDSEGKGSRGIELGLVGLIFLLLASILAPTCCASKERANRVKCASNLRQIGQAIALYVNDNGGRLPQRLDQVCTHADVNPEVLVCPSSNAEKTTAATTQAIIADLAKKEHCSYVYLGAGMANPIDPDAIVAYEHMENHEGEGTNVLFGDGHVEWAAKQEAAWMIAELKAGHNPPRQNKPAAAKPAP